MSGPDLDPELNALEASLRRLEPQTNLSRDRVLFEAGRTSARRPWPWPASTALSTTAALVLGWLLWRQPGPPPTPEPATRTVVVERIVPPQTPVPPPVEVASTPRPATEDISPDLVESLRLRRDVILWGVEILQPGPSQRTAGQTLTPGSLPRLIEQSKIPQDF